MISAGDVAVAVQALWTAANLNGSVPGTPGGLISGRVPATNDTETGPRPMPYAQLLVTSEDANEFYSGGNPRPYRASFTAEVTVYGVGENATDAVAKAVANVMTQDANWGFTAPSYLIGVWLKEPKLEQDETQRQGDDVWKASLSFKVIVGGSVP